MFFHERNIFCYFKILHLHCSIGTDKLTGFKWPVNLLKYQLPSIRICCQTCGHSSPVQTCNWRTWNVTDVCSFCVKPCSVGWIWCRFSVNSPRNPNRAARKSLSIKVKNLKTRICFMTKKWIVLKKETVYCYF